MKLLRKITCLLTGPILSAAIVIASPAFEKLADSHSRTAEDITLYFSDGTPPAQGVRAVNERLLTVGVRVSQVTVPVESRPLLRASITRALHATESAELIDLFRLDRSDLIAEISAAGRTPTVPQGGYLQTSEVDVPPYPKVYDMQALNDDLVVYLQHKFGRLHVNSSRAGIGIDEVMTIVSGGPYTWFFVLEDNVVGKLRFGAVDGDRKAWRISYPGLVPHGGFFDASHGLVVAYAHGPRNFVMRYDDPRVKGREMLGTNPWVDFTGERPVLLSHPCSLNSRRINADQSATILPE